MEDRTVVVTGLGVVSALGTGWRQMWEAVKAGKSGISEITQIPTEGQAVRFAAAVGDDFNPEEFVSKKELRRYDRNNVFGIAAAKMAVADAELDLGAEDCSRIGCLVSTGIGGISSFEHQCGVLAEKGPGKVSPFFIPSVIPNMTAGLVSIELGIHGFNYCVSSACATGSHTLSVAADMIRAGRADVAIAGGTEAPITPICLAGFASMRALSTNNDDYAHASRPFDAKRDGFVIGEGAGAVVLETLQHALARKAHIYAVLGGSGYSADAYHMTAPDPDGKGVQLAINMALKDAQVSADSVDYINAHGTSTPMGDAAETNAVKKVFGEHAYKLAISSTKSMLGHSLGAAGAVESIITILAVNYNIAPPTINYEYPDPECDLDYVPNVARQQKIEVALNNSFGFGGHNSVLVFKKYRGEGALSENEAH